MLDTLIRDDDQLTRTIDDITPVIDVVSVGKQFLESERLDKMERTENGA